MLEMEERRKARMEVLNLHSIYLLYWYKSTNNDAEARSLLHHYLQHLHLPTKFKGREWMIGGKKRAEVESMM
jgi:hypothetical protein